GAQAVHEWRDLGYLPEAMNAYLMRLGWSPGHDDILTKEEAAAVFDLAHIGKAPSRLDFAKLDSVNSHFMKLADDARMSALLNAEIANKGWVVSATAAPRLEKAVGVLKARAKTVVEMAEHARFLLAERPIALDAAAHKTKTESHAILLRLRDGLTGVKDWTAAALADALKAIAADAGVGMGKIGPALRAVLTGGLPAPDLGHVLEFLGRDEALARIADQL
ncbi:MAG: glutamate--tRNA ligase, partial [Alphaproteobacteria bacterium]